MPYKHLLRFLLVAFLLSGACTYAQTDTGDSLALVDLYKHTKGSHWQVKTNWLTTAPVSAWYGITVTGKRVTAISLSSNNLGGRLPGSFTGLIRLVSADFSYNDNMRAQLSASIGQLAKLQSLNLYRTATSSSLPKELGKLTQLVYLNAGSCRLTGSIPAALGSLSALITLNLSDNALTGRIPQSLGSLSNLETLDLSDNQLTGKLPPNGSFPHLLSLALSNNQLKGPLPGWMVKSKSLGGVAVAYNQLSGPLPDELQTSTKLNSVYASYNHFSGPIPEWLLTKKRFFDLFLDHNDFSRTDNPCTQLSGTIVDMDLSYNHYTFNGLECITEDRIYYIISPQAQIPVHLYGNDLSVTAGGTLSNNTYRWYKVGSADSVVIRNDSTFTPSASGSYYAKVTNKEVTTLTLFTDTVAYVKPAFASSLTVSLYPNPATDFLTINGPNERTNVLLSISDMTGYEWMRAVARKQLSIKVNVSRLKPGHYMLTANDGKEIKTIQFVKE